MVVTHVVNLTKLFLILSVLKTGKQNQLKKQLDIDQKKNLYTDCKKLLQIHLNLKNMERKFYEYNVALALAYLYIWKLDLDFSENVLVPTTGYSHQANALYYTHKLAFYLLGIVSHDSEEGKKYFIEFYDETVIHNFNGKKTKKGPAHVISYLYKHLVSHCKERYTTIILNFDNASGQFKNNAVLLFLGVYLWYLMPEEHNIGHNHDSFYDCRSYQI